METHHRVSVLHISSGDLWAGAEVQLFTLANALKNHTPTHVTLVLFNHGVLEQKLRNSGFAVHVLDESQLNGLQILWRLIKIIRKVQPDIVHTHRTKENILGSCAAFFSGNLPSLRTAHGAAEFKLAWHQLPKRLIHFMDYFCGRFLQKKIIAVSADLAVKLENAFPREKIDVIENGVDIDALLHDVSPAATLSSIQASTLKIGIAGRLVPVKRVDLFIEAAALLMQSRPDLDVSFHIYGDGPLRNALENQLAALNQKLGTTLPVHFEGHCEAMHQALAALDILLITSDHEGLPMILLEAMTLQVAVIAHAVGGIPRVLDQGRCGVLVEQHQANSYAQAIETLASRPESRKALIQKAMQRIYDSYSSKQHATNYLNSYLQLIQ